ncbi:GNAT family N-acetyltransferase [Candidatus Clostridium stratigraminis]|uniref:GNAT family N-acetyltransferase n=1 Tax=Candidatus Clostridium stratigraminis TaxID=3381661 RepID=A0ABW8T8Z1_9CLOT
MLFRLIEPTIEMEKEYLEYIDEWEKSRENIVPYASRRSISNYEELLNFWRDMATSKAYEKGFVPSTLYFLVGEDKKIYGSLHVRHELNDYLLNYGGHIGYGIRPTQRKKGYASKMLSEALLLPIIKELDIKKVLITCDKSNTASAKTIISNGGILENEIMEDGEVTQRYWIEIH